MESIQLFLENAAKATTAARRLSEEKKLLVLRRLADAIREDLADIIDQNNKDLKKLHDSDPKKDRLLLSEARIEDLAKSVEDIACLTDPANHILSEKILDNGLRIQKINVPLGVVAVIYESRPNVTIDVAALCIRSGNVCLLRGGTDALFTNTCLVSLIQKVLFDFDLDINLVQLLPADRKFMPELLTATKYVDILIPRGSAALINYVRQHATVPVIETGAGVCHTYVESLADLERAADIVTNAKASRPSVCNALDTILVDQQIAQQFLEILAPRFELYQIEIFADQMSFSILSKLNYPFVKQAVEEDFGREFLDFKCSVKCVENVEDALNHIRIYSSKHSEAIVSENASVCERFLTEVDAAAVFANASTRFTDGGVFGLGAEIGISTQKLHARGPFALEKLVTEKWIVRGEGQIR